MKTKLYILQGLFFLIACENSTNRNEEFEPTTTEVIAVNDFYTVNEDEEVVLKTLLNNDKAESDIKISSIDKSSKEKGIITKISDGNYIYKPAKNFAGQDSFSYTICNLSPNPNCSTAKVNITVVDQGNPLAVDDVLSINKIEQNIELSAKVLKNDILIDNAKITEINTASTIGKLVLGKDKALIYTAAESFIGTDSFNYTICDDDNPKSCSTASVTINIFNTAAFVIPVELQKYYQSISLNSDNDLKKLLEELSVNKHTTILKYSQRHKYLYVADRDETNQNNVILIYNGESSYWKEYESSNNTYFPQTFNTEHVYPRSLLIDKKVSEADLHHLRTCKKDVNTSRSNYPFVDGSGTYILLNNKWYPGDRWKGDVARMILYLNIRYGQSFKKVGSLELFLKWNVEDPVSSFELQRNNVIEDAQGNRNPFIDNPYLATLIWGGNIAAENKWK
ncbi:MAG: endonuclease [Tenacibaculum sp.]